VTPDKTKSRYARSLANLPEFVEMCDAVYVFDNTEHPTVVFAKTANSEAFFPTELWTIPALRALIGR
jgi:predicted ABC-type ATPase